MGFSKRICWSFCAGLTVLILTAGSAFAEEPWPFPYMKYPGNLNYCKDLYRDSAEKHDHGQGGYVQETIDLLLRVSKLYKGHDNVRSGSVDDKVADEYDFWRPAK